LGSNVLNTIDINDIGGPPGGRKLVEASRWPIDEAIRYFENEGVGRRTGSNFEILQREYFSIPAHRLDLPISFSIDERVESDLSLMLDVYANIYDLENRLRFYLRQRLEVKYGLSFEENLPRKVRDGIESHKKRFPVFVDDSRISPLEHTDFDHLRLIIGNNPEFVENKEMRRIVDETLDYLHDIRNLTAHNILIAYSEIQRIKEKCYAIRRIISQLTQP